MQANGGRLVHGRGVETGLSHGWRVRESPKTADGCATVFRQHDGRGTFGHARIGCNAVTGGCTVRKLIVSERSVLDGMDYPWHDEDRAGRSRPRGRMALSRRLGQQTGPGGGRLHSGGAWPRRRSLNPPGTTGASILHQRATPRAAPDNVPGLAPGGNPCPLQMQAL